MAAGIYNYLKHEDPTLPLVSVITPTKNVVPFIERSITSVKNQDCQIWEMILVDDSSTDSTMSLISKLIGSDKRFKLANNKEKAGASGARNTGAEMASGRYLAFLDADDYWYPNYLREQIEFIESCSPKTGIVCCWLRYANMTGRNRFFHTPLKKNYYFEDLLRSCVPRTNSCLIVRREAFEQIGGFDNEAAAGQDWDLCLRLLATSEFPILSCNRKILCTYTRRKTSLSMQPEKITQAIDKLIRKYGSNLSAFEQSRLYLFPLALALKMREVSLLKPLLRKVMKGGLGVVFNRTFSRVIWWGADYCWALLRRRSTHAHG